MIYANCTIERDKPIKGTLKTTIDILARSKRVYVFQNKRYDDATKEQIASATHAHVATYKGKARNKKC